MMIGDSDLLFGPPCIRKIGEITLRHVLYVGQLKTGQLRPIVLDYLAYTFYCGILLK